MFTGIVEALGVVRRIEKDQTNLHFFVESPLSNELKIDQSVSHNGVCLTVVDVRDNIHQVTAIDETLQKTNLSTLKEGEYVNLERCTPVNGRFDGHVVQGHVDQVATCIDKTDQDGSWLFTFRYTPAYGHITVEKGSITVNGISLTVIHSQADRFSVAIIPYTIAHTNLQDVEVGNIVNIEFDIIGKYVAKLIAQRD